MSNRTDAIPAATLEDIYRDLPLSDDDFDAIVDAPGLLRSPEMLFDLAAELGLSGTSLAIDAGCGNARQAAELARRVGCRLVGFEPVYDRLRQSNETVRAAGLSARIAISGGRIEAQPLASGAADLVLARDMLTHVADQTAALSECRRVLRPGGHMLIFTVFATPRLSAAEAEEIYRPLAVRPDSMVQNRFEEAVAASGFVIARREIVGSEWREWGEDSGPRRTSHQLLRVARMRRRKDEIIAQIGPMDYAIELADCLWGVYQMLGKLRPVVYVLRAV